MKTRSGLLLLSAMLAGVMTMLITACAMPHEEAGLSSAGIMAGISNADSTTKVRSVLLRDARVKSVDVAVVTLKGNVRHIGFIDSQSLVD